MEPLLALEQEEGGARLVLSGQWHLGQIGKIDAELTAAPLPASPITLDGARLEAMDTAAALALVLRLATAGSSNRRTGEPQPTPARPIRTGPAPAPAPAG